MSLRRSYATTFLHDETSLAVEVRFLPWPTIAPGVMPNHKDEICHDLRAFIESTLHPEVFRDGNNEFVTHVVQPAEPSHRNPMSELRDLLATLVNGADNGTFVVKRYRDLSPEHRLLVDEIISFEYLAIEQSAPRLASVLMACGMASAGPVAAEPALEVPDPVVLVQDEDDALDDVLLGLGLGIVATTGGAVMTTVAKMQAQDLNRFINDRFRPSRSRNEVERARADRDAALAEVDSDLKAKRIGKPAADAAKERINTGYYDWLAMRDRRGAPVAK